MKRVVRVLATACLGLVLLAPGLPARADGGPMVDALLWQYLTEGQQVAVITLNDLETARIDLFVSLLDESGESHQVVYFLPLGNEAAGFSVFEQIAGDFDHTYTTALEQRLVGAHRNQLNNLDALFGAGLVGGGIWLLPFWAPLILTGCGGQPPLASYTTKSSSIEVYALDETTDMDSLVATTGLDPSVTDSLERFRGQRIAVVNLQTRAAASGGTARGGEPGLHLGWTTSLAISGDAATYTYPLGTGSAWANPIKITRVYVTAPPGLEFSVTYPKLGADRSGYTMERAPRIASNLSSPGYAVDEARGNYGTIWRIAYAQSNAVENLTISVGKKGTISGARGGPSALPSGLTFLLGLVVSVGIWVLAWKFVMPRLMGVRTSDIPEFWIWCVELPAFNFFLLVPGLILYGIWTIGAYSATLWILSILFGGFGALYFLTRILRRLIRYSARATLGFIVTALASNGIYLLLALGYANLVDII